MAKTPPMLPLPRPNGMGMMMPNAPEIISWPFQEAEERMETTGSGHLHYIVTAYSTIRDDGAFMDSLPLNIEVDIKNVPDGPEELAIRMEMYAISRAQTILRRRNYRVSGITEICQKDTALKD